MATFSRLVFAGTFAMIGLGVSVSLAQMPLTEDEMPVRRALPVREGEPIPVRTPIPIERATPVTPPAVPFEAVPGPSPTAVPRTEPFLPPREPVRPPVEREPVQPPVEREPVRPAPVAVPTPTPESQMPIEPEPTPQATPQPPPQATPESRSMAETQLQIANGFYARKLYDMAVPEYEKYLGLYFDAKDRPAAMFRLGECYAKMGNRVAAKNSYQSLLLNYTEGSFVGPAAYRLANYYLQDENYSAALSLFERAEAKTEDPAVVNASRFYAARTLESLRRKSEARAKYESVINAEIKDNPYRDSARLSLAKLLLDAGRNDDAIAQFEALSKDGSKPELRAEAKVRSAIMKIDLGKLDAATGDLKEALTMPALGRWQEVAQLGLVRILYETGKFKEALETYEAQKDSLSDTAKPEALLVAANAHRQLGQHEQARDLYNQLVTGFPQSSFVEEAKYNLLISLYSAGDAKLAEAVDAYVAGKGPADKKAQALLLKAEDLFRAKKYAEAVPAYQAINVGDLPEKVRPDALFKLAWSLAESGNSEAASKAFTDFLKAYPDHALASTALAQRALARQRARDFKAAMEDFNRLLEEFPKAKERELALQQKALILGQQQENQAMAETFAQLLEEFPKSTAAAQANYWIGWAAFESKAYRKAIASLDAARKLGKDEFFERATLRIMLAEFYLGERDAVAAEVDAFNKEETSSKVPGEILRWLGGEYLEAKQYEESAKYLGLLTQREGDRTPIDYMNLARAEMEGGKPEAAKTAVQSYLETTAEPAPRATGLLLLTRAELAMSDLEASKKAVQEALSLQPEGKLNAQGRILTGDISMAENLPLEAAKTYLGVSVIYDDPVLTPEALHKAYSAYQKAGDAKQAAKVLNDLQTRFPEYSQTRGLVK